MARPSSFTQEIADAICEKLADGRSLRSICEADDMPHVATVCRWLADERRAEFREQYVRAREIQADALFEQALDIADTPVEGIKTKVTSDGKTEEMRGDMIEHRRLQVETRKWMVGKMAPKKYGDKLALTDGEGGPLVVQVLKLADQEAKADADNPAT
ncbi:terminase small subunit protein [Mesorhizobium temperatum]|uniref:Terminase small subunit protein n=1 Tax=Mesorhizobium temperatum TaxID=241416 RepID=A0A271LNL6_9HYPH|nr:terminase small subunit protein [Mesorhizobium temperatum]PAQ09731.1 terminase small subunit protein [Mesorhizobium temperatum]